MGKKRFKHPNVAMTAITNHRKARRKKQQLTLLIVLILICEAVVPTNLYSSNKNVVYAENYQAGTTKSTGNSSVKATSNIQTSSANQLKTTAAGLSASFQQLSAILPVIAYKEDFASVQNVSDDAETVDASDVDTQTPTIPDNVVATVSGSAITLTWDASEDNIGVVGYDIYQDSDLIGTTEDETTYEVTDVEEELEYIFTVRARDEAGNVSEASEEVSVIISTQKPTITEAKAGETNVTLSWSEVTWAKGYELSINGDVTSIDNVTTYVHTSVLPNTLYEYKIRAVSGSNMSDWSDSVSVQTAPGKVTNLVAAVTDSTSIQLTWNAVEGATAYEVEFNGAVIDTVNDTTYTHSNTSSAESNSYRVRAVAGELTGEWSDSAVSDKVTYITEGTISQDTVWDGGTYVVQGDIEVAEGITLQIMPGTIVKFDIQTGIDVQGKLTAKSTAEEPIVFTTVNDEEYGGSGGTRGDWLGINVGSTGEFIGDNVRIKYGGDYFSASVYLEGALKLENSVITDSDYDGIYISTQKDVVIRNTSIVRSKNNGIDISEAGAGDFIIKNNIIKDSDKYPIDIGLYRSTSKVYRVLLWTICIKEIKLTIYI
ncbi:fibronectin type III domain-containing protein [Anaerosporobacter sp.]